MLNLGAWLERSAANGPGDRYVLWLQGCLLHCDGCFSPEFWPTEPNRPVAVEEMARRIVSVEGIEGVTYTGGEPTLQAHGLALLSRRLRAAGLTVVCYTGDTIESLRARGDPWVEALLACTDILIDGPYHRQEAANLLWRGSANQRVLFLSDAYRHLAGQVEKGAAEVEFAIGQDGFTTTGTWPEGFLERLRRKLKG